MLRSRYSRTSDGWIWRAESRELGQLALWCKADLWCCRVSLGKMTLENGGSGSTPLLLILLLGRTSQYVGHVLKFVLSVLGIDDVRVTVDLSNKNRG
jgi:hypothetical protein